MTWEIGKEYLRRDGGRARLYALDGYGDCPLHGAYELAGGWISGTWADSGEWVRGAKNEFDLMPPEPPKRYAWINIYESERRLDAVAHKTFQAAEENSNDHRLGRMKVELVEGRWDE